MRIVFGCCSASLAAEFFCALAKFSLAPITASFGAVSVFCFVVNYPAAVLEDIVSRCLWHMTCQYLHTI